MKLKEYDDLVRQGKITKAEVEAMHMAGFSTDEAIINMAMLNIHERNSADWGEEDRMAKEVATREALCKKTATDAASKSAKGMSKFYSGGKSK